MEVLSAYSFATAGWFTLQSIPLILSPKLIVTMLSLNLHEASPLEIYFSRSLGCALLTMAALNLLLTGAMPWSSTPQYSPEKPDPYAQPTLLITTFYHSALAFYCYMQYTQTELSGFLLAIVGNSSLAAMGLWCILFATDKGHISRRTGKDKRVSGFPFKNVDADAARGKKKL
ncbi:uncharacterized protein PV09_02985 [Verruconis gallopava]|uniref:Uncharacterized protein n=1 Tax=Verruconis gallopava TaxID=253628 RepID=A0A0D2AJ52_9PEZI|nr:uncharacterized protein PV09_02985 [Verruconis gallopava]KIW06555.1 hypothetical protein PV09_02985 [Verruconis gallopava]